MNITVDSKRVFAASGGREFDPTKPTVILIHGAGQDRTIWSLQTRYLAHHGFSALGIDLPGHGGSDGPALESIQAMSEWLARLIEAIGIDSASLVGHSMGAFVALRFAADHPQEVDRVALVGVSAEMPVNSELLAASETDDDHAIDLMIGWSFSSAGLKGGHQNPGTWMLGSAARVLERSAPGVLFTDFTACVNNGSILPAAAKVKAPTLFMLGAQDKMTPMRQGKAVADEVMDSTVVVLPDVGHALMFESPNEVTQRLAKFLTTRT